MGVYCRTKHSKPFVLFTLSYLYNIVGIYSKSNNTANIFRKNILLPLLAYIISILYFISTKVCSTKKENVFNNLYTSIYHPFSCIPHLSQRKNDGTDFNCF